MDILFVLGTLTVLGCIFGSFVGASVWRLRARQIQEDLSAGEAIDKYEYVRLKPLTKEKPSTDRSRCLTCGHTLAWYDLLPLVSWIVLRGRCRYCKKPIGTFELFAEVGVGAAFAASYLFWPVALDTPVAQVTFGLWLCAVVLLAVLFAYDVKWFLLPDRIVFPLVAIGLIVSVLRLLGAPDLIGAILSLVGAVVILSGLYYFLWLMSNGLWIGFGDVKLGLALALLIGDWKLAFIALFSANLIGTLLVLPGMVTGRLDRKAHVPFGPLLIAGTIIAVLFGNGIVEWYQAIIF